MSAARWAVEEMPAGFPVASGASPDAERAISECLRYARQYAEDGPVRYWVRQNRKTVIQGCMAKRDPMDGVRALDAMLEKWK